MVRLSFYLMFNKGNKKKKKTLWPLFINRVELSQDYRATMRRHYFSPLSPQEVLVLI